MCSVEGESVIVIVVFFCLLRGMMTTEVGENSRTVMEIAENTRTVTEIAENIRTTTEIGENTRTTSEIDENTRTTSEIDENTRTVTEIAENTRMRRQIDYCNLPPGMCQITSPKRMTLKHVMCKYPTPGPSERCDQYRSRPIDGKLRARLLKRHNGMRNRVANGQVPPQPTAANMRQLSWDDQLASYAQRWVDQCVTLDESPHDTCRDTPTEWVGQNVGVVEHSGPYERFEDVDELVVDFYNEVKNFDPHSVGAFNADPLNVGHYAQLVWAESSRVGCARASYNVGGGAEHRHTRLVCNYSPAGLVVNEPVYEVGVPCTRCPNGTSCGGGTGYPALCATDEQKRETDMGRIIVDVTTRSDKGVRFVVGSFINGRCYCGADKSARDSLATWLVMVAVLLCYGQM